MFSFAYFQRSSPFLMSVFIYKAKDPRVSKVLLLFLTIHSFLLFIRGHLGIRKCKSMTLLFSYLDSIFLHLASNSTSSCLSLPSPSTVTDTAWKWIFIFGNLNRKWSRNRTSFHTVHVACKYEFHGISITHEFKRI